MIQNNSPFLLVKQLESDVLRLLSGLDVATLENRQQQRITRLKNELFDARLDIQDYELAETREHQLRNAIDARKRLIKAQELISSDTLQIFGAVDVAHLTARIGQINDKLR